LPRIVLEAAADLEFAAAQFASKSFTASWEPLLAVVLDEVFVDRLSVARLVCFGEDEGPKRLRCCAWPPPYRWPLSARWPVLSRWELRPVWYILRQGSKKPGCCEPPSM
jgi:hypothetical protein